MRTCSPDGHGSEEYSQDESGVTAIEYGLIAAIVGVGIVAVLKNVRTGLQSTFNTVNSELANSGS